MSSGDAPSQQPSWSRGVIDRRAVLSRSAVGAAGAFVAPAVCMGARDVPIGAFVTERDLDRLARAPTLYELLGRAETAVMRTPQPVAATDPRRIRFAGGRRDGEDTLGEAIFRLQADTDRARDLALAFAVTERRRYAQGALVYLDAWARAYRPFNFYDLKPDFARGTFPGMTEGYMSEQPWNLGLDAMWQGYGLLNAADAALLLRARGFEPVASQHIRRWLRALAGAVNASLHAWTRWADENGPDAAAAFHASSARSPNDTLSAGYVRHRSDNHLSWALAALLAGAAALGDQALAGYVLHGQPWRDPRAGYYANPSHIRAVIDWAVEAGPPEAHRGRLFEERIGRSPPIGYALFHLEAISLVARMADLRHGVDVWRMRGADSAGPMDAFRRYARILLQAREGEETEPKGRWLFALSRPPVGGADRSALVAARRPPVRMTHAIGPAAALFEGAA